ncbi:Hypothetical protein PBC10988_8990 [Planctomycetales bacterium 10988]|nr:Hypothetical protein PBC10988_8990 [Planctomycetales bacterium 10988]
MTTSFIQFFSDFEDVLLLSAPQVETHRPHQQIRVDILPKRDEATQFEPTELEESAPYWNESLAKQLLADLIEELSQACPSDYEFPVSLNRWQEQENQLILAKQSKDLALFCEALVDFDEFARREFALFTEMNEIEDLQDWFEELPC